MSLAVILGLYRAGMDAVMMKCLADFCCDKHEIVISRGQYVDRCDNFRFGELPDV